MTIHHVGIGQVVESDDLEDTVQMLGLGSCIGIFMSVPGKYVVAAHALLDHRHPKRDDMPGKFVDTAVPHLLTLAEKAGYASYKLKVSVAGGAQIFAFAGGRPELEIGARNIEAIEEVLAATRLKVVLNDTGGKSPRRAAMKVSEGLLVVESNLVPTA